jgi:hypothetical protein
MPKSRRDLNPAGPEPGRGPPGNPYEHRVGYGAWIRVNGFPSR